MNLLLEFVMCSGSCSPETQRPAADNTECRRRRVGRNQVRSGGAREWQPSLSSISEDVLMAERRKINCKGERPEAESGWRRNLKTKVSSISLRDRSRSFDHYDGRRADQLSAMMMPTTPFMF